MSKIIALYGKKIQADAAQLFKHLLGLLSRRGFTVICEKNTARMLFEFGISADSFHGEFGADNLDDFAPDILLSVGGDGSFLGAASLIGDKGVPILGINCGRMGFLANVAKSDIEKAIDSIAIQDYTISQRELLAFKVADGEINGTALNEVTVLKSDMASLLTIHVWVDGKFLTTYWADGLVISTPTGSTAYSMSAGGPIVSPDCRLVLLTPVSPHNLSHRPMAIPSGSLIEIAVESRSEDYVLCADSDMYRINEKKKVVVSKSENTINVVSLPGVNFYDTVRKKLYWGEDMRNIKQ